MADEFTQGETRCGYCLEHCEPDYDEVSGWVHPAYNIFTGALKLIPCEDAAHIPVWMQEQAQMLLRLAQ